MLSVLVAGGMFLSLYVIPFLKYPPNPPAVSLDETIRQRTLLYLMMVVLSAALLVGRGVAGPQSRGAVRRVERDADRGARRTSWPSRS